jgi:hypothetical protein
VIHFIYPGVGSRDNIDCPRFENTGWSLASLGETAGCWLELSESVNIGIGCEMAVGLAVSVVAVNSIISKKIIINLGKGLHLFKLQFRELCNRRLMDGK